MKKVVKKYEKKHLHKGSAILTTPIIIAIGVMLISTLIVLAVNILMPYIWYEKLSSSCIKYIFVMEEYGYLTKNEVRNLKNELVAQGFDNNKLDISYTATRVSYGNPIFLKVAYDYELKIPFMEKENIPMVIERNSVSKR